jgi:hydrogenase maturation protease
MSRSLVLGYGNIDRQDDGVAFEIVNAVRQHCGQAILAAGDTGLDALGTDVDSIFCLQLAPELLDVAEDYDRLVFVDAHVQPDAEDVYCVPVQPQYASATFTHHMTPALFLALLQVLRGREPEGWIVSVRGHQFDFEQGLSPETVQMVPRAVQAVIGLLDKKDTGEPNVA